MPTSVAVRTGPGSVGFVSLRSGRGAVEHYAGGVPELIEVVALVGAAPAVVFELELDVGVHAESMAGSREVASTSTGHRRLGLGDEVTFQARHFGLPWRMTSRITRYDAPHCFVDEQIRGPFRALHHEHVFEDLGDDRTRMIDRMTITAPFGPLGVLVTRVVLAPYLRRLLERRSAHIKCLADGRTADR
jgi:ligand-binding SRPBCC domain-containing protein